MGDYRIRADYRPNPLLRTPNAFEGEGFWTPDRILKASQYQYYVYRHAVGLAERGGLRRILDVGCGVGTKLVSFFDERFEIFGVDQREAIERCRQLHSRGTWFVEDLENAGTQVREAGPYDVIISSDVIEHLLDPDALLRYIRNLAGDETWIVLSTPERHNLVGADAREPSQDEHVREWSFREFREYVESSGFAVAEHRRQLPHPLGPNRMTFHFLRKRLKKRLPLRTNQMLVCRRA